MGRGRQSAKTVEERHEMGGVKAVEVESSLSERPGHPRSRIPVEWLNTTGGDGGSLAIGLGGVQYHTTPAAVFAFVTTQTKTSS